MPEVSARYRDLVRSEQDFASTTVGARTLQQILDQPDTPAEIATRLEESLRVGEHLRRRGFLVARANRATMKGAPIPGDTGDPKTVKALRLALGHMRDNPGAYRTPPDRSEQPIRVRQYRTAEEQEFGVKQWAAAVDDSAQEFLYAVSLVRTDDDGAPQPAVAWQETRIAQTAFRLADVADRLEQARRQRPPSADPHRVFPSPGVPEVQ